MTNPPARHGRPALLAEIGWIVEWRFGDHSVPWSAEHIDGLEVRVRTELLAPCGDRAAAVALDRLAPGKRRQDSDWREVARTYLDVLGELPADLLPLAVIRTLREWCSPELPPPGFVYCRVKEEMAERAVILMKLRAMRLRADELGSAAARGSGVAPEVE